MLKWVKLTPIWHEKRMIEITLSQWKKLTPFNKGYILYYQQAWNEALEGLENPYKVGTRQHEAFKHGQMVAVLECQDSEE